MKRKNEKILRPVHPNVGIQAEYRAKLDALVDEMSRSYLYWIKAQYRETPPIAMDALPARELQREMSELGKRWQKKFDDAAPKLARWFATTAEKRSSAGLKKILKDGGMSVNFHLTRGMRDAFQATVGEQVSLIKSVASQYHTEVEGMVLRSVAAGRDLASLSDDLRKRYGITKRRAAFIALDQNNKATSVFVRVRQKEAGVTEAIWLHSHAGKNPRRTHLANAGKKYTISEGWFDPDPKVRKWIWPGELPRCRCLSRSLVRGFS